jgi:O-antigen/teichoic acid export membrane protein
VAMTNFEDFAERTQLVSRLRRAILIFWTPLVILAVVPIAVTLGADLPWDSCGILIGVPLAAAIGLYSAYLSNKASNRLQWQSQVGLAPIALFALLSRDHSALDFAIVAYWAAAMLAVILTMIWRFKHKELNGRQRKDQK